MVKAHTSALHLIRLDRFVVHFIFTAIKHCLFLESPFDCLVNDLNGVSLHSQIISNSLQDAAL